MKYLILFSLFSSFSLFSQNSFILKNSKIEVSIDENGNLISLKNKNTEKNYASGKPIWRLYFDNKRQKDNEILAKENKPFIEQYGNQIIIQYEALRIKNEIVKISLILKVSLEENQVRFASELKNNEAHTVIRELQYPLVANCQLPTDHQLLNTHWGGQVFKDPKKQIKSANA